MKKFALCVSLFLLAAVIGYPQQFSLKLTGGMYFNLGNDYNKGIEGYNNYLRDEFISVTGEFEAFKNVPMFQGELIFYLNPNMAIGVGAGYLQWNKNNLVTADWDGATEDITYTPKLSVIPIFANFHYLTSIAPRLNLDLYAGPGLYLTKLDWTDTDSFLLWDLSHTFSSKSTIFGFQAGIGLDFQIAPNISLVVDGLYRYANITEVKGTWTESGWVLWWTVDDTYPDSYMWYYEDTSTSTRYSRVVIGPDMPSGAGYSGARKAEINLSGVTATAGIKISF